MYRTCYTPCAVQYRDHCQWCASSMSGAATVSHRTTTSHHAITSRQIFKPSVVAVQHFVCFYLLSFRIQVRFPNCLVYIASNGRSVMNYDMKTTPIYSLGSNVYVDTVAYLYKMAPVARIQIAPPFKIFKLHRTHTETNFCKII
jgi:hypothetical protein